MIEIRLQDCWWSKLPDLTLIVMLRVTSHCVRDSATCRIHWNCWGLVFHLITAFDENLSLIWNGSYQISKSLFSKCIMRGDSYPLPMKWQSWYLENACVKNIHCTLLPLRSEHVCAVVGFHWPLWRLAWNNGKLLTQACLLKGAGRLDNYDAIIASLGPREEQCWHSKPNVINGHSVEPNTI